MTQDELFEILTEIVYATRARLSEARPGDGLKAAEMLAKMCGWNEPEVNVQSVEVKVDAALIEQLRAGYAELDRRQQRQLAASVVANSEANGAPLEIPRRLTPPLGSPRVPPVGLDKQSHPMSV